MKSNIIKNNFVFKGTLKGIEGQKTPLLYLRPSEFLNTLTFLWTNLVLVLLDSFSIYLIFFLLFPSHIFFIFLCLFNTFYRYFCCQSILLYTYICIPTLIYPPFLLAHSSIKVFKSYALGNKDLAVY